MWDRGQLQGLFIHARPAAPTSLWSSPLFSGTGWVFTVAGTGVTIFTLYQVRNKNSAFRHALLVLTRRRSGQDLDDTIMKLKQLEDKISRAKPGSAMAQKLSSDWMSTVSNVEALSEIITTANPFDPTSQDFQRFRTPQGKRFLRSAVKAREKDGGTVPDHSERDLLAVLAESRAAAEDYLREPSVDNQNSLRTDAARALARLAYFRGRLDAAEVGELHDDR